MWANIDGRIFFLNSKINKESKTNSNLNFILYTFSVYINYASFGGDISLRIKATESKWKIKITQIECAPEGTYELGIHFVIVYI